MCDSTESSAEVVTVIERYVDDAHRRVLRSTTDPARGLLADVFPEVLDADRLQGIPETAPSSLGG